MNHNYKSAISQSLTDELTGLPNRRHLNIKLRELENKTGTICIADIDHFKKINDTYGHGAGGKVLRNIGLRMSIFVNDTVFISRSGGEEFAIVIFDNVCANEIIKNIKALVSDESCGNIIVTLSFGVAIKYGNDSSATIIASADDALYRAKKAGRDCIICSALKLETPPP